MNGNIEPAIIRVNVWTTVEFAVVPHAVKEPAKRVRPARKRRRIPALAGGWDGARRVGKLLRHGRWSW